MVTGLHLNTSASAKKQPIVAQRRSNSNVSLKHEKVITPEVNYSGDIFEKQKDYSIPNLYTAQDGKQYDIEDLILSRMRKLPFEIDLNADLDKFIINIKKFFHIDNNKDKFKYSYMTTDETLCKSHKISDVFFDLTGFEYNKKNVEKFISGKIKLKCEIAAEKYLGKKISVNEKVSPYISKYYIPETMLNQLEKSKRKLTPEEFRQYKTIKMCLPKEYQKKLDTVLKNGQLLQNNSEGKVSILLSLFKIATVKRADGINKTQLLKNCIDILDNPYIITQHAENIPEPYQQEFSKRFIASKLKEQKNFIAQNNLNLGKNDKNKYQPQVMSASEIKKVYIDENKDEVFNYRGLNTCAAASIEFELATQHPAEFFRMVEALTSQTKKVNKKINIDNSAEKQQLKDFKANYKLIGEKQANVTISADNNAYLLAKIQNKYQDKDERSMIDIIMQSAIMNLGSEGTYNSIDDHRKPGRFSLDNTGLVQYEIEFAQKILTGNNTRSTKTYKIINGQGIVEKNTCSSKTIKNDLLQALQKGKTIVAGCVWTNDMNCCEYGHEITIIGYTKNFKGEGFFITQDSDDWQSQPSTVPEAELLKIIHHATL